MSYLNVSANKRWFLILFLLTLALQNGWAQNDATSQPANEAGQQPTNEATQQSQNSPAPAFGQDVTNPSTSENPPISGLDQPSLEPRGIARSYFIPGAIITQSADSNIPGNIGTHNSPGFGGATRLMGSLTLQRLWARYETDMQYLGGGVFYEGANHSANQLHQGDFSQRMGWRTGQLVFRDTVSYLPEGSFGQGSYGGAGNLRAGEAGLGSASGDITHGLGSGVEGSFSAGQFGSLGQEPRLTNSAAADMAEALSPRSTITLAGSYGLMHFANNPVGLVDSNQFFFQGGYDRQISRTDQIAVTYGYQTLNFPKFSGSSVNTNTFHFVYGHRITGRLDFVAGAGPQITQIQSPFVSSTTRISASGNLRLRYHFSRAIMEVNYRHYNTNGSGYFLGATSDVVSLSGTQALGRIWELDSDIGFANNKRLAPAVVVLPATSDQFFFAGAAAHRHVGRNFRMLLSYQYSRFAFNNTVCQGANDCGKVSNRQMGAVGFEWYPRPMRLD